MNDSRSRVSRSAPSRPGRQYDRAGPGSREVADMRTRRRANRSTNLAVWLARMWGVRMIRTEYAMHSVLAGVSPRSGVGIGRERRSAFPHVHQRASGVNTRCHCSRSAAGASRRLRSATALRRWPVACSFPSRRPRSRHMLQIWTASQTTPPGCGLLTTCTCGTGKFRTSSRRGRAAAPHTSSVEGSPRSTGRSTLTRRCQTSGTAGSSPWRPEAGDTGTAHHTSVRVRRPANPICTRRVTSILGRGRK